MIVTMTTVKDYLGSAGLPNEILDAPLIDGNFQKWKHPFTCMIAGPTKSGKSTFTQKLIENKDIMIKPCPDKVIWCYSEWKPDIPGVTYIKGIPDPQSLKGALVVFDDLMSRLKDDPAMVDLFTKGCHHWGTSIIHIVQDFFYDKRRTNRINSQYIVLTRNPADKLTAQIIARQMYPGESGLFMKAYTSATKEPYGYLLVDLDQNTPDQYRLRDKIFPGEINGIYMKA